MPPKNLERCVELLEEAQKSIARLQEIYGDEVDITIADRRYGWINGLVRETVQRPAENRLSSSGQN